MILHQDFQILFHFLWVNLNANTLKTLIVALTFLITTLFGDTWKVLVDNTKKYTIQYPSNWEALNEGDIEYIRMPYENEKDKFRENVNIICMPNSKGSLSYDGFEESLKQQLSSSLKEFTYIKGSLIELNSKKMLKINYLCTKQDYRVNIVQYLYITKSTYFIISTSTIQADNPSFFATAEKIVSTIKEQ